MFKFLSKIRFFLDRDAAHEAASRIEDRFDKLARFELDGDASVHEAIATGPLRLTGPRSPCRIAARDVREAGHKTAMLFDLDLKAEDVTVSRDHWEPAQGQFKLALVLDIRQKLGPKTAQELPGDWR